MKCVRNLTSKLVTRVTDVEAREQFLAGKALYVPRRFWKMAGRP